MWVVCYCIPNLDTVIDFTWGAVVVVVEVVVVSVLMMGSGDGGVVQRRSCLSMHQE